MRSSRSNTRTSLPSWASYTPQTDPGQSSLIDEEFQLRQKAFQHASAKVSRAYQETMGVHVRHVTVPLRRFFLRFQPGVQPRHDTGESGSAGGNCSGGNSHKRQRVDSSCTDDQDVTTNGGRLNFDFQKYMDSIRYDPSLLPIAVLHLAPSVQDRAQIVKILKRQLTFTKRTRTRKTATSTRNVNHDLSSANRHPPYPDEIQIGKQESTSSTTQKDSAAKTISNDAELNYNSQFRPAVCIITDVPSSSSKTSNNSHNGQRGYRDHGEYIRDILIQCIQQEANPYEFIHLLSKRSTKSLKLGYTDRLIEWAGKTCKFNSIVIVFENPEMIPRKNLDSILGIMSQFRSTAGVPVCLIMNSVSGSGDGGFDLMIGGGGLVAGSEAGLVIEDFRFDSSRHIYNEIFHNLYTKQGLPILFSDEVLQRIQIDFCQYHASVAEMVLQLKMALAHHFTKRGSFLSLAEDSSFLSRFGINLAWFCADSDARKWIFGKNHEFRDSFHLLESMQSSFGFMRYNLMLCAFIRILGLWILDNNGNEDECENSVSIDQHHSIGRSKYLKVLLAKVYDKIRSEPISNLTALFVTCYKSVQDATKAVDSSSLRSFLPICAGGSDLDSMLPLDAYAKALTEMLENSIFSLEMLSINAADQEAVIRHFRESLVETLHGILWNQANDWSGSNSFSRLITFGIQDGNDEQSFLSSMTVEPRRLVASSISSPYSLNNDRSFDMSVAFRALDTRVISTNYWFGQFTEKVSFYSVDGLSKEELLQRFAFAVYQLMYCGFVVRSHRKTDSFEKGAMVWASILS